MSARPIGGNNRRFSPQEALRRASVLFLFMFVIIAGLAVVLEGTVDWKKCLEGAAFYSIAMTAALTTLQLMRKYQ